MKSFWSLFSVVAVVNLLAVLVLAGWLIGTGRLDRERWLEVRALLASPNSAPPPPAPVAQEEPSGDLVSTSMRIDARARLDRQTAVALRRLGDEKEQLSRSLEERRREVESRESTFADERRVWESETADARASRTNEQFRKTVRLLESVPPKQAKAMVLELVRTGEVDQAVAYIDAMSPYKASSLLKAFKGDEENRVATDLLERLRRRASGARTAGADGLRDTSRPSAGTSNGASAPATGQPGPAQPVANSGASVDQPASGGRSGGTNPARSSAAGSPEGSGR